MNDLDALESTKNYLEQQQFAFNRLGEYTITLTVVDEWGNEDSDTMTVVVNPKMVDEPEPPEPKPPSEPDGDGVSALALLIGLTVGIIVAVVVVFLFIRRPGNP